MKQVLCDICGKPIKGKYTLINLPSKFAGYIMQSRDEDEAFDVCESCALELYNLIEDFRKDKKEGKAYENNT